MIVDLVNKKGFINDDYSPKFMNLQNTLLIIIVDSPKNDVSHYDKYH